MHRALAFSLSAALGLGASLVPAQAEQLMTRFSGEWVGTGQVLLGGKYGSMFRCKLKGAPSEARLDLSGRCWLGALSAPVTAQLRYNPDTGEYYGEFMDGADGRGADIIGARTGEALSLKLSRGAMQGRLTASKVGSDQMKVMLYYRDPKTSSEQIAAAMGFARPDANSLPQYMPNIITGSIAPN